MRLTRDRDEADDLLQETVLRAYRCFYQFARGTNCRAWLLTILYNLFRTRYRRGRFEQLAATVEDFERELESNRLDQGAAPLSPEDLLADRAEAARLRRAVDALPVDFRETLLLVDLHELNYQEAARVLEVPLGTVKSRVSRARALLRVALAASAATKTGT
jgi:RNA polymerase sigma-70 factor (ECF subfamily)